MVDLQEHLAAMNQRITSGLTVQDEDWKTLRQLSGKLGDTLRQDVEFEWDIPTQEEAEEVREDTRLQLRNRDIRGKSVRFVDNKDDGQAPAPAAAAGGALMME